jgi:hypothetical protein
MWMCVLVVVMFVSVVFVCMCAAGSMREEMTHDEIEYQIINYKSTHQNCFLFTQISTKTHVDEW